MSFLAFLCIVNSRIRGTIGKKNVVSNYKMENLTKTVLKGQVYVAPKAESVEVSNQGLLCCSADVMNLEVNSGFLS